jgi:hypothetical protein
MRLISTDPQFTWSGTGYIVGVFTVLGTTAGLATAARHRHRPRSLLVVRGIGIVLSLGCFVAAGAAMLPTIVPAALGRARTDWNRLVRIALVATGAATAVILSLFVTMTELPPGRFVLGLTLYLALCGVEVEMTARLYAPSLPAGTFRRPLCQRWVCTPSWSRRVRTRRSMSSRMGRTAARSWPAGSGRSHSS